MVNKDKILQNMINISNKNQIHDIAMGRRHLVIGINKLNEICVTFNLLGLLTSHEREILAQFFGQVRLLCLFNDFRQNRPLNDFYNIGMFVTVRRLELVNINLPSIRSFGLIQSGVRSLTLDKCSSNLSNFLMQFSWSNLSEFSVSQSSDPNLLPCLKFMHSLTKVKLVFCSLTSTGDHFLNLVCLKELNLSFNKLGSLPSVDSPLSVLILRGNFISSLVGVGKLRSLTDLDVSFNTIGVTKFVEEVSQLTNLRTFDISDNPIDCVPKIRQIVMKCLFYWRTLPNVFVLNGRTLSKTDKTSVATCDYQLSMESAKKVITLSLSSPTVPETTREPPPEEQTDTVVSGELCSIMSCSSSPKSSVVDSRQKKEETEDAAQSVHVISSASSFKVFECTGALGRSSRELVLSFDNFECLSLSDKLASYQLKIPFRDVIVESNERDKTIVIQNIQELNKNYGTDVVEVIQLSFDGLSEIKRFDYLNKICSNLRDISEEALVKVPEPLELVGTDHFASLPQPELEESIDVNDSIEDVAFLSESLEDSRRMRLWDRQVIDNVGSLVSTNDCGDIFSALGISYRLSGGVMTYLRSHVLHVEECFVCGVMSPLIEFGGSCLVNGAVILTDKRLLLFERLKTNTRLGLLEGHDVEDIRKLVVGFGHCTFHVIPESNYVVFTGSRTITDEFFNLFKNVSEDSFNKRVSMSVMRRQMVKAYLYQTVNLTELIDTSELIGVYLLETSGTKRGRLVDVCFMQMVITNKYVALMNESLPFRLEGTQFVPFTALGLHVKINFGVITKITVYPNLHELILSVEFAGSRSKFKKLETLNLLFVCENDMTVFREYVDRCSQSLLKTAGNLCCFNG